MKNLILSGAALSLLTFTGCQSPLDDSLYQQWSRSRPAHVAEQISQSQQEQSVSASLLASPATLANLIAYAQAHNPTLATAQYRIEQAQQLIPQVTSLDDPMFTVAPVGSMAQTADGQVTLMSSLSQKVPLSGKLATRGQAAQAQVNMAMEQLRQTQLTVTRDVKQAYWTYQLTRQTLAVLQSQRQLMQQFNEAANAIYRAGRADQQDLLRITVEISQLDNRVLATTQQQQSAIARINALLNRPANAPLIVDESNNVTINMMPLEDWQKQAINQSPQLQSIHHAIAQARSQLKLAHQQRIPDLTVMLNYAAVSDHGTSMAADGTDQLYAGLGINLPIWQNKLDAAEKQAIAKIREMLSELIAVNNQLQYNITDTYQRVQSQQQQDMLYHDTILPQAQQVVDSALSQYRSGRSSFLNLIDNWRKQLELELMAHRNQTQLQQDYAQLQFLAAQAN